MHKTVLVSGPAVEPVTVAEAKTHLHITSSTQDTYIGTLITTARRELERYLNRAFITQSWKVYYDCWQHELLIPFGNLQIADSTPGPESPVVKYYNTDGNQITLTANDYYWVVNTTDPARIVRKYDVTYPELQYGRPDAIEIAFSAGFGDAATAIPDEIKHAMKLLITNYYEHRGDIVTGGNTVHQIPKFITDLVHSYKLYGSF
jgi:uncharacterized phiE125 gp8 family phage protein